MKPLRTNDFKLPLVGPGTCYCEFSKENIIVYDSKLYGLIEDELTGLYREGPVYLYDMLCEERATKSESTV